MRMLRDLAMATAACGTLLLVGCGGASDVAGNADASTRRAVQTADTDAAEAETGYEDIPTMEELESQMAEQVTDANADAEFEKLQQELAAEEDG